LLVKVGVQKGKVEEVRNVINHEKAIGAAASGVMDGLTVREVHEGVTSNGVISD